MEIHRDVLRALRLIPRQRSFAVLVVLCMALGIGVSSATFSVIDAALLRALPYRDPDRLAVLLDVHQSQEQEPEELNVSPPNFLAWRERNQVFASLQAMTSDFYNLTDKGEPERIQGAAVTSGLFPLLGVQMALGQGLPPEGDRPGGPLAAVISHDLWRQRFGASPSVLGRPLVLDGQAYTIAGVAEPGFNFLVDADVWVPLAMDPLNPPFPTSHYVFVAGRLKPGVTFDLAKSQMKTLGDLLAQERPDTNTGWTVQVVPLREQLVGDLRHALLVLLASVGFVLLIACANVSNLLLTRSNDRSGEFAIRSALGAGQGALIRQIVVESVVLSLIGGVVGLLLASSVLGALPRFGPSDIAMLRNLHIDGRVLGFTVLVSLLAGMFPAFLPAFKALRPGLYDTLKAGTKKASGGVQSRRVLDALIIAEIALSLVLLVGAGLMIKSFHRLYSVDPGFNPRNVLEMQVALPDWKYAEPAQRIAFWRDALTSIRTLPGVVAAGITSSLPVNQLSTTTLFTIENRALAAPGEVLSSHFRRVTPGFFRAMDIPLVRGRLFTEADDDKGTPVAVISEEMARVFWPHQAPIGQRLQRQRKVPNNPWFTVVGIVKDVQDTGLGSSPEPAFYIPYPQNTITDMNLVVRTAGDPLSVLGSVRHAIQQVDPSQPIAAVETMEDWISGSLSRRRFSTFLLSFFAVLGLTLAVVGIYGVLSYSVLQRRQEMGIRMALGADGASVKRLILQRSLTLTLLGIALGTGAALLLTRLISGLLFEVEPTDPVTFFGIAAGLLLVAGLASYLPARRAARVDPIVSLRYQ